MNEMDTHPEQRTAPEKFYMPAIALPTHLDRIEDVVSDLFDFHGVVLIPDSYNK